MAYLFPPMDDEPPPDFLGFVAARLDGLRREALRLSGGAGDGLGVVLAEDAFDGDAVGAVLGDQVGEGLVEVQQPQRDVVVGFGVDDVVADELAGPAGLSFDDADSAAGESRVDAEHAHHGPPLFHVRVFDTLIRVPLALAADTPRR